MFTDADAARRKAACGSLTRRAARPLLDPRDQQVLDRLSVGFERTATIDHETHLTPGQPRIREFFGSEGSVAVELTTEPRTELHDALREAHAALDRAETHRHEGEGRRKGGKEAGETRRTKAKKASRDLEKLKAEKGLTFPAAARLLLQKRRDFPHDPDEQRKAIAALVRRDRNARRRQKAADK